jgi:hypothetical protein
VRWVTRIAPNTRGGCAWTCGRDGGVKKPDKKRTLFPLIIIGEIVRFFPLTLGHGVASSSAFALQSRMLLAHCLPGGFNREGRFRPMC